MSQVKLYWVQDGQFVGVDSTQHSLVLSTTQAGTGVKPSDMLLIALASCSAVDVVNILEKKRESMTGLEIRVDGQQDDDPPWAFRKIQVTYVVRGRGLSEKAVRQAVELAEEKYCSVAATLRGVAEITHHIEIIEENK